MALQNVQVAARGASDSDSTRDTGGAPGSDTTAGNDLDQLTGLSGKDRQGRVSEPATDDPRKVETA